MKIYINPGRKSVPDKVVVEKEVVAVELSYYANVIVWLSDLNLMKPIEELSCEPTDPAFRIKLKDGREIWIRIGAEELNIHHYEGGKHIHEDMVSFITKSTHKQTQSTL